MSIITGALAVASAAVGSAFGVAAIGDADAYNRNPTVERADIADRAAVRADMFFGIAFALGVTTAIMIITNNAEAQKPTAMGPKTLEVRF